MGRSNTRYRNIMEEAENTDTVQQDEIILGSISLKDLMKKVGNKEDIIEYGAYLIISASQCEPTTTKTASGSQLF